MSQEAKAITKYIRVCPRKARLAAALIRGLPVSAAAAQLAFCRMKAGVLLNKTLQSAIANAVNNSEMKRENLVVKTVLVDCAPHLKRAKAGFKGSSAPRLKRFSHFTVVVATEE